MLLLPPVGTAFIASAVGDYTPTADAMNAHQSIFLCNEALPVLTPDTISDSTLRQNALIVRSVSSSRLACRQCTQESVLYKRPIPRWVPQSTRTIRWFRTDRFLCTVVSIVAILEHGTAIFTSFWGRVNDLEGTCMFVQEDLRQWQIKRKRGALRLSSLSGMWF